MSMVLVFAVLAALFGWLAITDLRTGRVGLVVLTISRSHRPIPYWAVVVFETLFALLSALVALAAFLNSPDCDDAGVCTVTIKVHES